MAVKRTKPQSRPKSKSQAVPVVAKEAVGVKTEMEDTQLDPQEEKILDWILKAVVAFVLGWLALAVLMVIGGFFHLWG